MPERKMTLQIKLKRAYDISEKSDGQRVLVDRVWPRGRSKDDLQLDDWLKAVAPSEALRTWFDHDPAKWNAFKDRYFQELEQRPEAVERLIARCHEGIVTLVFGARDVHHNNAVALKAFLEQRSNR